jgi:hypothetical protein
VKYHIPLIVCTAILSGCASPDKTPALAADSSAIVTAMMQATAWGTYKGDFDGSPIFITVNYAGNNHIAGYNVHKGLRRNLSGKLSQEGDGWAVQLNEPGDHPYDGRFHLVFDKTFTTAHGKWTPLNTPSLREKQLTLTRLSSNDAAQTGNEEFMSYALPGEHADITFDTDGSCKLNYYEKINDSSYAPQLNTVRGTWERTGDEIRVNWEHNEQFGKRNSTFKLIFHEDPDSKQRYLNQISGEGFEFYMAG